MIRLIEATKLHQHSPVQRAPTVVLANCTMALPASLVANIDAEDDEIRTLFLEMLYGTAKPDRGRVVRDGVRLSPIINLRGGAQLLIPTLTVRENIHFQARLAHVDANTMCDFVVSLVDEYSPLISAALGKPHVPLGGEFLTRLVNKLNMPIRRALETTMMMAASYDCYLVDHFDLLHEVTRLNLIDVVHRRRAGLIFAATRPAMVKTFAESTISVRGGMIELRFLRDKRDFHSQEAGLAG